MTTTCGDTSKFLDSGLEEQETNIIFCPNNHAPRRIPVYYNRRWRSWEPVNQEDILCPVCGADCNF